MPTVESAVTTCAQLSQVAVPNEVKPPSGSWIRESLATALSIAEDAL